MAKPVKVVLTLDQSQFKKGMVQARGEIQKTEREGSSAFGKLKTAFAAIAGAAALQQISQLADSFTLMSNRLRSVTNSTEEFNNAFKLSQQVANATRSDLTNVTSLFADLTLASKELGLSQEQVASTVETFSKALKISGADTSQASSAALQFGQALAGGVLRGEEFNSLIENNKAFMQEFSRVLGISVGDLRKLAEEGALTGEVVIAATEAMANKIDQDFGKTLPTIQESFIGIRNELVTLIGTIEEKTGVFGKLAGLIKLIGDNLEFVLKIMAVAFSVAVAQRIVATAVAMMEFVKAIRAAVVAGTLLQGVTGIGLVKVGAGIAAATAAIAGMNALFDDTIDSVDELAAGTGDIDVSGLPGAPNQTVTTPDGMVDPKTQAARDLLATQREVTQAEKDQKKEATALANEIARNKTKADELLETNKANLQNKIDQLALETEMLGLSDREKEQRREIADIEAERKDALAEIQGMTFSEDEAENAAIIAEKLGEINDLYDEQIKKVGELQDAFYEASTEFGTGFMEAFENFKEMVEDNAAYGARIFQTLSDGWTNAILDFVETGKLSFKDLFKSLMQEIIKMQANKLFLSLFGTGGVFGDLFAGFFAAGGRIPQGKFGIAGERGPEVVMGPATVVGTSESADMLGGMGGSQVNYTINAVDAPSFQQLVARDPSFIYNVVQVGARRQPR
jgi:lambda family phage tail tape measure protein